MAITVSSIDQVDFTANRLRVEMTLATTGSYVASGVAVDFAANGLSIPSQYPPTDYHIFESPGAAVAQSGSDYFYNAGSTLSNGTIQIFKGGTEQGATAFPTATLKAVFWFPSL